MLNYEKTRPNYVKCVATSQGWTDEKTGELLVAIRDLDKKLKLVEKKSKRKLKNSI